MINLNRQYEIVDVIKDEAYDFVVDPPLNEEEQGYFDYMKEAVDAAAKHFPREKLMIDFTVNNGWDDDEEEV